MMSVNFVNSGISSQSIDTSWPSRDSEIHIRYFDVRILAQARSELPLVYPYVYIDAMRKPIK